MGRRSPDNDFTIIKLTSAEREQLFKDDVITLLGCDCIYPGCKLPASKRFAGIPLCVKCHCNIEAETQSYYDLDIKYSERKHYQKICGLIPWRKDNKRTPKQKGTPQKTGFRGVTYDIGSKLYRAHINIGKKPGETRNTYKYLGSFLKAERAVEAIEKEKERMKGGVTIGT